MGTFSTVGDVGDAVILLGIISQIPGGPHDLILRSSQETKMKTPEAVATFHRLVQPLFESQIYIKSCRIAEPGEPADWDSGEFRGTGFHSRSATLFDAQLAHLVHTKGIGRGFSSNVPWITVEHSPATKDRVVIARSGRYRNGNFNWQHVVDFYGDRLLFVGLPHEYQEFCGMFGMVQYLPTAGFLEVAQAIAGSLMFIGNQSSPMAVAEGLKHRSIQETSLDPSDCVYKRYNAQYCYDGTMTLPGFGLPDKFFYPAKIDHTGISKQVTPPGMWQFDGFHPAVNFKGLCDLIQRSPGFRSTSREEIEDQVKSYNVAKNPDFYKSNKSRYHLAEMAMKTAGY